LRIHRAGDYRDDLAQQGLRIGSITGCDDGAGAFIAHGQWLAQARLHCAHCAGGHARDDFSGCVFGIGQVGGTEQQAEVRRVDRRRLDPDQHLVVGRFGQRFGAQFDGQTFISFKRRYDVPVHNHGRALRDILLL